MECKNCKSPVLENERFCANCGAPLETAEQSEPAYDYAVSNDGGFQPPKKKSKKKILFAIIAAVLVLAIATVAFAGPVVKNFACKTFMSPSKYLMHVEKENMEDIADEIGSLLGLVKATGSINDGVSADVNVTLGNFVKNLISENVDSSALPYISWINKIGIGADMAFDGSKIGYALRLSANDKAIANINAALDTENKNAYISIPDLADKAVRVSLDDMGFDAESINKLGEFMAIIPDEDVVSSMICRYMRASVSQIKNVTKGKATVSAGGAAKSCTLLTAAIDEPTCINILKAVITEAKNDSELKKIVANFAQFAGEDASEIIETYDSSLSEALQSLNETTDFGLEEPFFIDVWVDNRGDVLGVAIRTTDASISAKAVEDGKKTGIAIEFKAPGAEFAIAGVSTESGSKSNAEYDIMFNGMNIVKIVAENIDSDKYEKGILDGKVIVSASDTVSSLLSMTGMDSEVIDLIANGRIEISSSAKSAAESAVKISVYSGSELIADVDAAVNKGKGGKVAIPTEYVDADKADEWAAAINYQKLIDSLVEAGAPQELKMLGSMLNQSSGAAQEEAVYEDSSYEVPAAEQNYGIGTVIE